MERSMRVLQIFISAAIIGRCLAVPLRVNFENCNYKGFTCQNSVNFTGKIDLTFQCNTTITTQDIQINLWIFNAPATTTSLTIKNCDKVQISFACTSANIPIQWIKIQNVGVLAIQPSVFTQHPPEVYFENIQVIENIPRNTFAQIKYDVYKPGCFIPLIDLNKIDFNNVNIGNIETGAFRNLSYMKSFTWTNVSVNRVSTGAVKLNFESGFGGELKKCKFGVLEPLAFQVVGDTFSIANGKISDIWGSGFNGTFNDFYFNNNSVSNIQSGGLSILAQNVYIFENHFESVESGAFQKIGPGLFLDSKSSFGVLHFIYKFNNNLIENMDDGGVRPDLFAYKDVAVDVSYNSNTLECLSEGLTWYGADIDLGFGFSVIKDFKTIILEPQRGGACTSTQCMMCFGVKPPAKKNARSCGFSKD